MSIEKVKASIVEAEGKPVTTVCEGNGVGYGYLYNGVILGSCGNGWYSNDRVFPYVGHLDDDGQGYMDCVRGKRTIPSVVEAMIKIR